MKKILFLFVLSTVLSCKQKISDADILNLNGYWEIEKVILPDGEKKEYKINETIDFFKVENKKGKITLTFYNSNIQDGIPIAIILQYGHGTGTGGWVQGRDYINPAVQPIFDKIAEQAWKEVTK